MTTLVAATLAVFATLLAVPGSDALLGRVRRPPGRNEWRATASPWRRWVIVTVALAVVLAVVSGVGPRLMLVLLAGGCALAVVRKIVGLWRLRRARRQGQRFTIAVCDGLAAELRAGLPALTALVRACADAPGLASVATAARVGADIPASLRSSASAPGADGLRALAAAWEVAASSGAGLAAVLERVAASLRSEEEARAEVMAALGPPRATAKMLAVLPLAGIAMGESMGSAPVSFLLGTAWGLGCLAAGVVLALAGVWWVELLASAAER